MKFQKYNFCNIIFKKNDSTLATFWNISKMCKIETFQWNLSTIFLKLLNIYLFSKIFPKVKILMLRWNILQYLTKMLKQYFSCNERLKILLTCFCNILCYVGSYLDAQPFQAYTIFYLLFFNFSALFCTNHTFPIGLTVLDGSPIQ